MQTEACEKKCQDQGKSDVFLISALFVLFVLLSLYFNWHIFCSYLMKGIRNCALMAKFPSPNHRIKIVYVNTLIW